MKMKVAVTINGERYELPLREVDYDEGILTAWYEDYIHEVLTTVELVQEWQLPQLPVGGMQ